LVGCLSDMEGKYLSIDILKAVGIRGILLSLDNGIEFVIKLID